MSNSDSDNESIDDTTIINLTAKDVILKPF